MEEKKILVVDDEQNNLKVIFNYLSFENSPYKILNATNGKIAYEVAGKKFPDLIIMDWEMPVMNGIEAIKMLKKDITTKEIPIIMATGIMTSAEHLEQALKVGAVDYVRKPVEKIELLARVRSALKLSESYQQIKEQKKFIEDQKNRQLSTTTMHILQKNEMLSDIGGEMEGLGKLYEKDDELNKKIRKIRKMIKNNIDLDKDWRSFSLHFESVHQDFFKKLQEQFPELTQNELRFCAYVRMSLPTKALARLLNIHVNSVKITRYRIKKKLELPKEQNLTDFIMGF